MIVIVPVMLCQHPACNSSASVPSIKFWLCIAIIMDSGAQIVNAYSMCGSASYS
jgi:hypothetical protein